MWCAKGTAWTLAAVSCLKIIFHGLTFIKKWLKTNNHWSDWWEIWTKVISLNCAWKLGGFETSGGVYDWGSPRNDIYIQLKTFYCRGNTMAALNMFTGNFLSHQEGTTILYHTVIWRSTRWMGLQAAWLWYCNPGAQKRLFGFLMVRLGKIAVLCMKSPSFPNVKCFEWP